MKTTLTFLSVAAIAALSTSAFASSKVYTCTFTMDAGADNFSKSVQVELKQLRQSRAAVSEVVMSPQQVGEYRIEHLDLSISLESNKPVGNARVSISSPHKGTSTYDLNVERVGSDEAISPEEYGTTLECVKQKAE